MISELKLVLTCNLAPETESYANTLATCDACVVLCPVRKN